MSSKKASVLDYVKNHRLISPKNKTRLIDYLLNLKVLN